jgi:hypothetical protein
MNAISVALDAYYRAHKQFPFQKTPPAQYETTVTLAAQKLVVDGQLTAKEAEDNDRDAWGAEMLYLLYNYKSSTAPTVVGKSLPGLSTGDWSGRINNLFNSGDFNWKAGVPVMASPGADDKFGTGDDVINDRSL